MLLKFLYWLLRTLFQAEIKMPGGKVNILPVRFFVWLIFGGFNIIYYTSLVVYVLILDFTLVWIISLTMRMLAERVGDSVAKYHGSSYPEFTAAMEAPESEEVRADSQSGQLRESAEPVRYVPVPRFFHELMDWLGLKD